MSVGVLAIILEGFVLVSREVTEVTVVPDKVIIDQEVIAVDEDPGDVTEEEDYHNEHENDCQIYLPFCRSPRPQMCKPISTIK